MALIMYSDNQQTNRFTRESNEHTEIELKIKMKPIFVLERLYTFWIGRTIKSEVSMSFFFLLL